MILAIGLVLAIALADSTPGTTNIPLDFPCYDQSWIYSAKTGRCYKQCKQTALGGRKNALEYCSKMLSTFPELKVGLASIEDKTSVTVLMDVLMSTGLLAPIWLDISSISKTEENFNTMLGDDISSIIKRSECFVFSFKTESLPDSSVWEAIPKVSPADCSTLHYCVCQHATNACNEPKDFDKTKMEVKPASPFVGTLVESVCKPGLFQKEQSTDAVRTAAPDTNVTLKAGQLFCTGQRQSQLTGPANPVLFNAFFTRSGFREPICQKMQCTLIPALLTNAKLFPEPTNPTTQLAVGYGISKELTCNVGYVSSVDPTQTRQRVKCEQISEKSPEGSWTPGLYKACTSIRCSMEELLGMVPENGVLLKAQNTMTSINYGENEINQFPLYKNDISIGCKPGYMFDDRSLIKKVSCQLKPNSLVEGTYVPVPGTVLPIPDKCEMTSCLGEALEIRQEFRLKPYLIITSGQTVENVSKSDKLTYPTGTKVQFYCSDGFETINGMQVMNLTCGNQGQWVPELHGCLAPPPHFKVGPKGRFQGVIEEAKSAKAVSTVLIGLVFVLLGFILLLDVLTIGRDVKSMTGNVKLQQARLERRREQNGAR